MTEFKPYRELTVAPLNEEEMFPIADVSGKIYGWALNEDDAKRLADCWNACRKIAFPHAHIEASEEYIKRLEKLRKEAWARVEELEKSETAQ